MAGTSESRELSDKVERTAKPIVQDFFVRCRGRDLSKKEVLEEGILVQVNVSQIPGSNIILGIVNCPYSCGTHGKECNAAGLMGEAYQSIDLSTGKKYSAQCPYSFVIPNSFE